MSNDLDLGPCCACGQSGPSVRNVVMLDLRAPQSGTGWGCFICRLPSDGALAVVCDACLAAGAPIRQVCDGYATSGRRVPRAALTEPFCHDLTRHLEAYDGS